MKKFISIVFFLIFLLIVQFSFAQELTPIVNSPQQVDYQMPYPGLLPDSPLYFLKAFRDKIISFLISDPLKRAQFDLLEADKRMSGSRYLFEQNKNKEELVISTISKGENYFEEGIVKIKEAKKEGQEVSGISGKFHDASIKHQEILKEMEIKAVNKEGFKTIEKRIAGLEKEVNSINP